ncbi:fatty-acid O-methyltransferase Mtf2 [Mycobacterium talmoniae]|uniref:Phthiotriol/phenolphthiotriol dimycocerosates methyltransferase n=1 Tax=Mycobacterium talmoniae TaxID=1858794 RepID=A0A2S8BGV9_9MYCO|nr:MULTISPECIES: class I SAM-dependent methyltransferase [Mycobacterium]PQM45859.1 Phthiotriol/phenolphthiotriol dimycocerosates methyltransferase [Mycobacterium talmoniae]TDH54441.1 class I SAM-dependent methyltransferase [Mycobacterium eburneum]
MDLKDRVFRNPLEWNFGEKLGLKHIQKYIYPFVTRRFADDDVVFINYGYEEDPPMGLALDADDEPNRYCIQLYHSTATQADDLRGKRVLEVGCGHGGGASYLTRTLQPASYTGLDLNSAGIAFCQKRHNLPGLKFVQGDAEKLPFPDESFDAVINIESSVHYPHFPVFLTEVARVLSPGGHFLYADSRLTDGFAAWDEALANGPLRMLSQREINAEVVRGLEKNAQHTQDVIDRHVPGLVRGLTRAQGSWVLRTLQTGRMSYRMYCFVKD